jgi:hypothetical protein
VDVNDKVDVYSGRKAHVEDRLGRHQYRLEHRGNIHTVRRQLAGKGLTMIACMSYVPVNHVPHDKYSCTHVVEDMTRLPVVARDNDCDASARQRLGPPGFLRCGRKNAPSSMPSFSSPFRSSTCVIWPESMPAYYALGFVSGGIDAQWKKKLSPGFASWTSHCIAARILWRVGRAHGSVSSSVRTTMSLALNRWLSAWAQVAHSTAAARQETRTYEEVAHVPRVVYAGRQRVRRALVVDPDLRSSNSLAVYPARACKQRTQSARRWAVRAENWDGFCNSGAGGAIPIVA